jgi:hypothetical protein
MGNLKIHIDGFCVYLDLFPNWIQAQGVEITWTILIPG